MSGVRNMVSGHTTRSTGRPLPKLRAFATASCESRMYSSMIRRSLSGSLFHSERLFPWMRATWGPRVAFDSDEILLDSASRNCPYASAAHRAAAPGSSASGWMRSLDFGLPAAADKFLSDCGLGELALSIRYDFRHMLVTHAATRMITKPTAYSPARSLIWMSDVQLTWVCASEAIMKPVSMWARASSRPVQTMGATSHSGRLKRCTPTRERPTNNGT